MATKKSQEEKIKEAVSGEGGEKKEVSSSNSASENPDESESSGGSEGSEEGPKLTDIPGIGPAVATKLESAGVYDLMALAVMSPSNLSELAGVGEAVARKAIQAARSMLDLGFQDGSEYAKKTASVDYITTGSEGFDNMLGGQGIESRAITESFGAYGSSKTQLGMMLSLNVQLPKDKGGANGKCVFIDTEGTFKPKRVKQMAEGIGANPDKVLKNILVARAFNSDHQILLLDKVSEMIKNKEPIKLLVIDSLTAHFRAEYSGRGQLADRQQKLNKYMHDLMKLAEQHNLAVYVTNQVMANPAQMFGDPTTAIGGNIVGHACLTGDSLIQMSDGGIREIKDMSLNDRNNGKKVLSSNFSKMSFQGSGSDACFVNPDVKKVYEIKTNNQVKCSPLHRFFTVENFSLVEKEAKNLKKGEFVAQAGKIPVEGEKQKLPEFETKKLSKISKSQGKKISKKLSEFNVSREEICSNIGVTQRQFRRILNQESPTDYKVFERLNSYLSPKKDENTESDVDFTQGQGQSQSQISQLFETIFPEAVETNKHKNLSMPQFMAPSLGQVFGYFIGDGNLEERGLRFRDERQEVLQSYNKLFLKIFGVKGKISKVKNKNCYTLYINSKEIKEFFEKILPDVYNYIGRSKEDVVGSFIKGFVDAEGYINKKRVMITIAQKQSQILRYLQLFLLRFGIKSTIKYNIGRKNMNVLRIQAREVPKYLNIGFTAKDKQEELFKHVDYCKKVSEREMMPVKREEIQDLLTEAGLKPSKIVKSRPSNNKQIQYKWVNRKELTNAFRELMNKKITDRQIKQKINFISKILNSDINFSKIREINVSDNKNKELFYDFSVPETENYLANGFVVHNSTYRLYLRRGKKDSRVAKLIDSPNLPDSECAFYVTDSGIRDKP